MTPSTTRSTTKSSTAARKHTLFPRGSRRRAICVGITALVVFIVIWQLITAVFGLVNPILLPSATEVGSRFIHMLTEPYQGHTLGGHALTSLKIVVLGWIIGGIIGMPLGILMGWNRWIRAAVNPIFQVLRPIPPIAWIPLAILWFGLGDSARIYVVWLAAVVPWILNSFEAVRSVDSILISAARMLGASQRTILTDIVAPSAVPVLVAGARISLGNAWTTLIAAELLAASAGLGFVALNARRTLDSDIMLVAMFTIGILGVIFTGLLYLLERAVSRGRVEEVSL